MPRDAKRRARRGAVRASIICFAALAGIAGCEGQFGDSGKIIVQVDYTTDVSAIDLSNFGITGSPLPSTSTKFTIGEGPEVVTWTSSGIDYAATVTLKANEGERGTDGIFPANDSLEIPVLTAMTGKKGKKRHVRFWFRQDELHILEHSSSHQGTIVP